MEFKTTSIKRRQAAFTMTEVLVASSIGGLVLAAILSATYFTSLSIASIADSVHLNGRSRYAIDRMSQKVRMATGVTYFSPTSITVTYNGKPLTYTYRGSLGELVEIENSRETVLMKDCESMTFDLYKRNPVTGTFNQFPASTTLSEAKLIRVKWECRTTLLGKQAGASEMFSAKIVLRAK